jgi:periplasmic protein TonB
MTAAPPRPHLFSILTTDHDHLFRPRKDTFLLSLLGQAAILALIIYFTSCVIRNSPDIARRMPDLGKFSLVFSGFNGGGGGNHDRLPASNGRPPHSSLEMQIVAPSVMVPTEMPKLPMQATVMVAPDVSFPVAPHIGDPSSPFSKWLSDGSGGPGGMGSGCCNGIGPDSGPYVGEGPPGIHPAGRDGVTVPEAIYSPEPSFSEEARKAKFQGVVMLMVVVGKDGHPYNIHVRQSLGMGLDEKAIEAVRNWRFRPATFRGQPVATQIAVQVDFHLY